MINLFNSKIPIHTPKDIFVFGLTERTSLAQDFEKVFHSLSPNPPTNLFLPLLLDLRLPLVFLWQGGQSTVDFLILSSDHLFVFDAKVSHQCYDKNNKEISSHTVSLAKLVPQSSFLQEHPDCSAAILFWSPRIGPKFQLQPEPDKSVTINRSSSDLEQSLRQYLAHNKDQEKKTSKKKKTMVKKPSKEVRAEK